MEKSIPTSSFIQSVFTGIGQILLQENRWSGLLFSAGVFVAGWPCGLALVGAALIGTSTAVALRYPAAAVKAGLYGFSPALVGVALAALFKISWWVALFLLAGSALAAVVQHFFIRRRIPVFTLPFILVTWLSVFLLRRYALAAPASPARGAAPLAYAPFEAVGNGFGEVLFQSNSWTGILCFIGVFISQPMAALYGLAASLLGAGFSLAAGQPPEQVQLGLFGFNAVLTALVFAGPRKTDGVWVGTGVLLTVLFQHLLLASGLLQPVGGAFTFPFVAGTWATLLLQKGGQHIGLRSGA